MIFFNKNLHNSKKNIIFAVDLRKLSHIKTYILKFAFAIYWVSQNVGSSEDTPT